MIKRILWISLFLLLIYAVVYASRAFPIISGYGAKDLCSCTMIAGRSAEDIVRQELNVFPLNLGTFTVDYTDSSATGTVFGLAKRKAIYRKGTGCTLLVEMTEQALRDQYMVLPSPPVIDQDTVTWPYGNAGADSVLDHKKLEQVVEQAFDEPGPKKTRRTRAIVVVYDGKIIAEKYAEGFDRHTKQIGWSMTKSITNALVGILVKQGKLKIDAPAPVAAWKDDDRSRITLHHLMQASSGLKWEENYGGPSGATNMLFKKKDMGLYAAEVPLEHEPGKVFYYSSGTTNIISRIIRETVGDGYYYKFPYEALFYKLGMLNTVLEIDAGGTIVGSSYSFGTARDFARFGLLYLQDGVYNGERILPEGWVKYSTTPALGADRGQYGAQFWLNAGAPGDPSKRYYPDVPADMFWADGYEGQNVFIIPSKKLVVVKLSLSQNGEYLDDNEFLAGIISSLPGPRTEMVSNP